jgi:peptide chain release factor 1
MEEEIREKTTPRDPNDLKSVIIEIRAGAGGEEAALFCGVLYNMYSTYAQSRGWSIDFIDSSETELGGYKEIIFSIEGQGAYSRFKYESGVHRVQRVPVTESSGRVHTSTVTVAVLPEVEAVELDISPNDLRIDTFRASGAGGQHVNRTDSAIRITHIPTGLVAQCQDQRSQYKNKDKAMAVLMSRIKEMENERQNGAIAQDRKSQVGTGDRSERIRTYNYHQGRVSDHRIGLTLYRLEEILGGDLDEIINALAVADRSEMLASGSNDGEDK